MINELIEKLEVRYPKDCITITVSFSRTPRYRPENGWTFDNEIEYCLWIGSTRSVTTKSIDILTNHVNQIMDEKSDTFTKAEKVAGVK